MSRAFEELGGKPKGGVVLTLKQVPSPSLTNMKQARDSRPVSRFLPRIAEGLLVSVGGIGPCALAVSFTRLLHQRAIPPPCTDTA